MSSKEMAAGIVCEFNPFHNGHKYLISEAKRLTGGNIVCAMSSNFVQRGENAFADKVQRAKIAVENGADVVFENPFPFSCATAEIFAKSAVSLLGKSGLCNTLVFGVENDIFTSRDFFDIARVLLDKSTEKAIKDIIKSDKTIGYAAARSRYVSEKYGEKFALMLDSPNLLLGVEYAKAIIDGGFSMDILAVTRAGCRHDGAPSGEFASASFLRKNFTKENAEKYCPSGSFEKNGKIAVFNKEKLYAALCARLLFTDTDELAGIAEVPHEYAGKMKKAAEKCADFDGFFESLKAKHMTDAKIRRMLLYTLLDVKKEELCEMPNSAFLLGFSEQGAAMVKKMKKQSSDLVVLSKISDIKKLCDKERALFEKQLCAERMAQRLFEER